MQKISIRHFYNFTEGEEGKFKWRRKIWYLSFLYPIQNLTFEYDTNLRIVKQFLKTRVTPTRNDFEIFPLPRSVKKEKAESHWWLWKWNYSRDIMRNAF